MAGMHLEDSEEFIRGLDLRVIWKDADIMEIRARAGNGSFAGSVSFYVTHDRLQLLAASLRGFPATIPDLRQARMGMWEENNSVGGLDLSLECSGSAGRCTARIHMRHAENGPESVNLVFEIESAAVDRFVAMLESCGPRVGADARLSEAGRP